MKRLTLPVLDESGCDAGLTLTCHRRLASELRTIFSEMRDSGFKIKTSQTACFSYRMVRGFRTLSQHSYGAAVDVNWADNPAQGMTGCYDPATNPFALSAPVLDIWRRHGFLWGGDWKNPDYMHLSYTGL